MYNREVFDTKGFIKKASRIHRGVYDYSEVEYVKSKDKVSIVCLEHGRFHQTPSNHLQGFGCTSCGSAQGSSKLRGVLGYSTKDFIRRSREIHGDTYDYSESVYEGSLLLLTIICQEHGRFKKTSSEHLAGAGCQKCGYSMNGTYTRNT